MRSMAHAIVQAVEVRGRPGHLHVPQYSVQSALSATDRAPEPASPQHSGATTG